jgi:hypothetical protein
MPRVIVWLALILAISACIAQCQQDNSQDPRNGAPRSLPEAPFPQAAAQSKDFLIQANPDSPLVASAISMQGMTSDLHSVSFALDDASRPAPFRDPFAKYFRRSFNYGNSTSNTLVGRATSAATRMVLQRDDAGKVRLNSSYILTVLASAAAHSAARPYWRRSASQPIADFGSTVGNDAGLNVFHEFEPGIRQVLKSHEPHFVSRIEARINRK